MRRFSGISISNINPRVLQAQYAVRGELVLRALAHAAALEKGEARPFKQLLYCNIGNPQDLQQPPLTFFRQVLSLCNWPDLLSTSNAARVAELFPEDALARAKRYMSTIPGGLGAYTHSQGIPVVRNEVVKFLEERDGGVKANSSDLFLTDGASPAARTLLSLIIRSEKDGVMVPVPQYPLYSATIALQGGTQVDYFLNEEKCWSLEINELERSYAAARAKGVEVRAMVVINPGNPTGNVLTRGNIEDVVRFCARKGIVLIADEVYQANIWNSNKEFTSFKRVAVEMNLLDPKKSETVVPGGLQLASMHSTSKGFVGECGRRGGYLEVCGFDAGVRGELYKLASLFLCSNTTGQIMMGLQCQPPKAGDVSFPMYEKERLDILSSLSRRALQLNKALSAMEGASCQPVEGALYAFPQITLPKKAVEAASQQKKAADVFYCLELLDHTGIVVVPGSGFGQKENTFHFRSTILPPEKDMDAITEKLLVFHKGFMKKYS